ncbi:MAG: HAD-IA family hydrolase [Pseudomonadota bacterium]
MQHNPPTLILDLDGTISDPSLGITRSINYALEQHDLPTVSDALAAKAIGPPLDHSFLKFAPKSSHDTITSLVGAYRERYAEVGYAENIVYPDIPGVLETLHSKGIRLGVCTSKRVDFAHQILALFDLTDYFDFVSGGEIGISKGMQLAELLEAETINEKAIMIGDRAVDITAAHQNELHAVGVLWGFGDYAELSAESPWRILKEVKELLQLREIT